VALALFTRQESVESYATHLSTAVPAGFEEVREGVFGLSRSGGRCCVGWHEQGESPELEVAVGRYNARHESSMESLVERAESLGLTRAEKNLLDRQSARAARDLLGPNLESACRPLPARFDSHEFDPAD
jgi:hypothetical protein